MMIVTYIASVGFILIIVGYIIQMIFPKMAFILFLLSWIVLSLIYCLAPHMELLIGLAAVHSVFVAVGMAVRLFHYIP
ncbi:MAG: hypothetical protein DI565_10085 [Ancylobacter novellus]|uniref:Uncharacterized protein n=1 Tax=Ancylobacter novellus TaxID=921 RepID=A0A2W5KGT8_ANCNO|nr:MAG: hypothetical protein DI565_10085 [Ancylobacter novellus]